MLISKRALWLCSFTFLIVQSYTFLIWKLLLINFCKVSETGVFVPTYPSWRDPPWLISAYLKITYWNITSIIYIYLEKESNYLLTIFYCSIVIHEHSVCQLTYKQPAELPAVLEAFAISQTLIYIGVVGGRWWKSH